MRRLVNHLWYEKYAQLAKGGKTQKGSVDDFAKACLQKEFEIQAMSTEMVTEWICGMKKQLKKEETKMKKTLFDKLEEMLPEEKLDFAKVSNDLLKVLSDAFKILFNVEGDETTYNVDELVLYISQMWFFF